MKVNQNVSVFMGINDDSGRGGRPGAPGRAGQGKKAFNGSYLNGQFDPIENKRAMAQKRANKIIGDTHKGERKIDNDLVDRAKRIDEYYRQMSDAYKEVQAIDERKEQLRQEYGVDMDSQEQKDLEILEKYNRQRRGVIGDERRLTPEEYQRALELDKQGYGEKGYTEYQQRALEMDSGKDIPLKNIQDAKTGIVSESKTISVIKLKRLEYHKMVDAQEEADEILKAASDDIIGMLVDEAKDNIDEKNEEELEKVQERREEKKEEQEKLEAIEERRKLMEALADPEHAEEERRRKPDDSDLMWGDSMTEGMVMMQGVKNNIEQEVSDMMLKVKLAAVEVKGMDGVKGMKIDELL